MVEGKEIAIDTRAVAETTNPAGRDIRSLTGMTTDAADSDIRALFCSITGLLGGFSRLPAFLSPFRLGKESPFAIRPLS